MPEFVILTEAVGLSKPYDLSQDRPIYINPDAVTALQDLGEVVFLFQGERLFSIRGTLSEVTRALRAGKRL